MDHERFDALARVVHSRRSAIAGGLGLVATLLGVAPEADAHNARNGCRKLADPTKRRACQRRARAHNRKHRCKSRPPRRICAELGQCQGTVANDCGQLVNCRCPKGQTCMENGGCAPNCPGNGEPGCPEGCRCVGPEVGGGPRCMPVGLSCEDIPQACDSTAGCPAGHFCLRDVCWTGPTRGYESRCMPLCPAHA